MRVAKKTERRRGTKGAVVSLNANDPDGFGRWMARHLEWMKIRNYSEATVAAREPWLVAFALWCEARGISRPRDVTKPILERYRRHLFYQRKANGRPLTFGSQHTRLAPLKLFFAWMTRENALLWNPASELDLPKVERRLPRALTIEEVESVLAQPDVTDVLGIRDRAILETLYATGMRRTECIRLALSDVDAERGTILIREGKGKKDRMLPIGERAIVAIERYLNDVRPSFLVDPRETTLFLTERGERLTRSYLSHRVGRYVRAANVGKQGACHLLRHTMATVMLEAGADVRFIQEMLGHANLETTEIYTRVSIRMLKAVYEATHPAAKATQPGRGAARTAGRLPSEGALQSQLFSSLAAEAREEAGEEEEQE
jgi:integrase/recombinase XerD